MVKQEFVKFMILPASQRLKLCLLSMLMALEMQKTRKIVTLKNFPQEKVISIHSQ